VKLFTLGHGTAKEVDLAALMRANGVRWALGGFRRPRADSPNVALRHPSFRGYADYMQTLEFLSELQRLYAEVLHIMHSGPLRKHVLTDGVRALPTGVLQYDVVDV
jgi:hypothetical protein